MEQWSTLKKLIWLFAAKLNGGGVTKTVSGSPAHITGALAKAALGVLVNITPTQSLHGYSNPWPAGGGENKFGVADATDLANGTSRKLSISDGLMTVSATGGISSTVIIGQSVLAQVIENATLPAGTYYFKIFDFSSTVTGATADGIKLRIETNGTNTDYAMDTAFTLSADSTIVGFYVASALQWNSGNTMKLRVAISSTNVDSWTPYSNICPITGLTGLSVYRTGKNLLDPAYKVVQNEDNVRFYYGNRITLPAGTYTMSGTQTFSGLYVNSVGGNISIKYNSKFMTFTLAEETAVDFNFYKVGGNDPNDSFMLEVGSSATTYEPYNGSTYAVDWSTQAGTVYGGTLDVVTGVLTVDRANIASYNGEVINEPWLSSMDAYVAGATPTTGAQVVYTLATPLTYQLTGQEVQMLLGENYVWSSSGDTVSVTYYAEGNANDLQSLNILLGGRYSNPKTSEDVSDKEALEIILGGNK